MKKIAIQSLCTVILYGIIVCLYLIYKTQLLLTIWEIAIIISAFVVLRFVINLSKFGDKKFINKIVRFAWGMAIFSTIAHTINLLITRPLIAVGRNVPTYFQIGYWFSTETLIDNIGWGLFLGISFVLLYASLREKDKVIAVTAIIIGTLCIAGFLGGLWNMNLWYLAPMGYGIILMILCVEIIFNKSFSN